MEQDFVNEDLFYMYPMDENELRRQEKQNKIFGTKSLKKEYGYFKQLEKQKEKGVLKVELAKNTSGLL